MKKLITAVLWLTCGVFVMNAGPASKTVAVQDNTLKATHVTIGKGNGIAGSTFEYTNRYGSVFEFEVNDDNRSVTLTKGDAKDAELLEIPATIEALNLTFDVTDIDDFAFNNISYSTKEEDIPEVSVLKGVKKIIFPDCIETVGQNAFEAAPDLEEVYLSSNLTTIPYCVFLNCKKLRIVNIPKENKIKEIESFAFGGCTSLEEFTIPRNVSIIGEAPWRGCNSLKEISKDEDNYYIAVYNGVLYSGWLDSKLIQYPAGKQDKEYQVLYGTKEIGNSAFYGNPYIERVEFPMSLDSISHIAFYDCASLSDVVFTNRIDFIGNSAFEKCPKLNGITLYGNPKYTNNPGDTYNTFWAPTKVTIEEDIPDVKLPKTDGSILDAVFDHVSAFKYFEIMDIKNNEDYNFKNYWGKGTACGFGNSTPKPEVMRVLAEIPSELLAYEDIEYGDRINCIYFDKSDIKNPRLLYCFIGIGGNDLMVAIFKNGDIKEIEKFISTIKK